MMMFWLAQTRLPPMPGGEPPSNWLPILLLILIGVGFAAGNLFVSLLVGPSRTGPGKATAYESGMIPVGDTRRRFNVRFYLMAVVFLVIDVEIIFFYPWATIFAGHAAAPGSAAQSTILLAELLIFAGILVVAYVYAWGKGVFRWD